MLNVLQITAFLASLNKMCDYGISNRQLWEGPLLSQSPQPPPNRRLMVLLVNVHCSHYTTLNSNMYTIWAGTTNLYSHILFYIYIIVLRAEILKKNKHLHISGSQTLLLFTVILILMFFKQKCQIFANWSCEQDILGFMDFLSDRTRHFMVF